MDQQNHSHYKHKSYLTQLNLVMGSTMADPTLLQGFELAESLANTCPKITEKIYKNIENEITKYIENNREEILREMQKTPIKREQKLGRDKLEKDYIDQDGACRSPP